MIKKLTLVFIFGLAILSCHPSYTNKELGIEGSKEEVKEEMYRIAKESPEPEKVKQWVDFLWTKHDKEAENKLYLKLFPDKETQRNVFTALVKLQKLQGGYARFRGMRESIKSDVKHHEVKCRVIDQYGKPVTGADVEVGTRIYSPKSAFGFGDRTHKTKTNKDGYFSFKGPAIKVYCDRIAKEGYDEFKHSTPISPPEENFPKQRGGCTIDRDKSGMLVWTLRKRGKPAFVLKRKWPHASMCVRKGSKKQYNGCAYTLFKNQRFFFNKSTEELTGLAKYYQKDFIIKTALDEKKEHYIITVTAPGDQSGVTQSDKKLYEAPQDGYKKEAFVKIKSLPHTELYTYFYLKIRGGRVTQELMLIFTLLINGFTLLLPHG